jgi:hypothetical protein
VANNPFAAPVRNNIVNVNPASTHPPGGANKPNVVYYVNEQACDSTQSAVLASLQVPPGSYWYDSISGLYGQIGGPSLGVAQPGLGLPGPMSANASGLSNTSIYINGRQVHQQDVLQLQKLTGNPYIAPGRYFLRADGNWGPEGGGIAGNLIQSSQKNNSSGGSGWNYQSK